MPTRTAHAEWNGPIDSGEGRMAFGSGAFEGPYSFKSRMQDGAGTNPEELIGAAHAGCFTMQLSAMLEKAGHPAEKLETKAVVRLESEGAGFTISYVKLTLTGKVPGMDAATFQRIAGEAKASCPVSKLFKADISLEATLG
jgi:osmotically inducible protein OsmC